MVRLIFLRQLYFFSNFYDRPGFFHQKMIFLCWNIFEFIVCNEEQFILKKLGKKVGTKLIYKFNNGCVQAIRILRAVRSRAFFSKFLHLITERISF